MKKRSFELLSYLLINKSTQLNIEALSQWFRVTERTIRNDIQEINDFLIECKFKPITLSDYGVINTDETLNYDEIVNKLNVNDYYSYKLSAQERSILIQMIILTSNKDYVTIDEIAQRIKVSRPSIINDLSNVKKSFTNKKLNLLSKPNKGMRILDEEMVKRKAIIDIFLDNAYSGTQIFNKMLLDIFDTEYKFSIIKSYVKQIKKQMNINLSKNQVNLICFCFYVVINRSARGKHPQLLEVLDSTYVDENKWIIKMADFVFDKFDLSVSNNERRSLYILINQNFKDDSKISEDIVNIQIMVAHFLYEISDNIGVDLYKDEILFENLVSHIDTTSRSKKQKHDIFNPYCQQIQDEYKELYNSTEKSFKKMEKFFDYSFSKHEIAYITMHVSAALQKNSHNMPLINILVVCQSGNATGVLLATQLVQNFRCKILATIPISELSYYNDIECVDLIVSSCDLYYQNKHVIVVNPILSSKDIIGIQRYINYIKNKGNINEDSYRENKVNEFIKLLNHCEDKNMITEFLEDFEELKNKYLTRYTNKSNSPLLSEIIDSSSIVILDSVKDWKEGVKIGGDMLVENKLATEEYVGEMINNAIVNGPYYVITKNVALAHTKPQFGALSTGISLVVLKKPVEFGREQFDPVNLIFCLSTNNSVNTVIALSNLIRLCKRRIFVEDIIEANNPKDIYKIINMYEKGLKKVTVY